MAAAKNKCRGNNMIASIFREDVERYLRLHGIRFTPSVNFTGISALP
jgi:hypothetical protein